MLQVASLIIISGFAVFGIYSFVTILLELLFHYTISNVVTVVPVTSPEQPLAEMLGLINKYSSGANTVVVDLSGQYQDKAKFVERGLCSAITSADGLGEAVTRIMT